MYSTEKTNLDLLLDEKKELEDRLHGMQQNIHNGNDIQYNVNRYNRELEKLQFWWIKVSGICRWSRMRMKD